MKDKNLVISGIFMLGMFLFLMVGTAVMTGTMYGMMAGMGLACMFLSMYFWCRFALPLIGGRHL